MTSGWPVYPDNLKVPETAVSTLVLIGPTPHPEKYIRLGTIKQIRSELGAVYRLARTGKIASGEATRLCYILNILANMTLDADIEGRIETLEKGQSE